MTARLYYQGVWINQPPREQLLRIAIVNWRDRCRDHMDCERRQARGERLLRFWAVRAHTR